MVGVVGALAAVHPDNEAVNVYGLATRSHVSDPARDEHELQQPIECDHEFPRVSHAVALQTTVYGHEESGMRGECHDPSDEP